jgi:dihydroneopterin aldolase
MRDAVSLTVDVRCIVGLLARERTEPQRLRIHVLMETDLEAAGATGHLWQSVDYGAIDGQIRFLAEHGRFVLLESLALTVARLLVLRPAPGEHRATIANAEVTIEKPDVLQGSLPAVRLRRTSWDDDVLADLPEVFVRRRTLAAGEAVTAEDGAHFALAGGNGPVLEVRQRVGAPAVTLPGS